MIPLFDYSWFEISSIPIQIPLWLNHQFDWLNSSKLANFPIFGHGTYGSPSFTQLDPYLCDLNPDVCGQIVKSLFS